MRLTQLGIAALALPLALRADTIEMADTGLKLEGKVHRETEDAIIFLVHDESGKIRIPKSKIKNIEYDINTQLESLNEDDLAGRYKVGLWAMEKGMYKDAAKLFEELVKQKEGNESIPNEIYKQLGRAYEMREQFDKALQSYSDYLKANPDDAQVAESVVALTEKVNPATAVKKPDGTAGETVAAVKKIVDGLEADGTWVAEPWPDSNPGRAQIIDEPGSGNKMVAAQSAGGTKDKVAFSRTGPLLNLSESHEMLFDAFNKAATPLKIAIAFTNSQGEYFESKQITLQPNAWLKKKSVKIDTKEFKSDKNKFLAYDQDLAGRERVSRIIFLVYGQRDFTLYIDGLFFK